MTASARALLLGLLAFAVAVAWGPFLIAWLRRLKFGKRIREEGPQSHMGKTGTPTMGGWLMVGTTALLSLALLRDWPQTALPLAAALIFAVIGSLDDLANMRSRSGHGFQVRWKFPLHGAISLGLALLLYSWLGLHSVWLPALGNVDIGAWYVPLAALAIFSTAAAVNEADGLDGLAAGLAAIAFAAYGVIALRNGQADLAAFCLVLVGSALGFLWFNVNPARMFMGDAGALALGAGLATVALVAGQVLLVLVIGLVFVAETASVLLQVAYFRLTHGRRLFKMSPLHHHFELSGWTEVQTVQRFWLVGLLAAGLGLALFLA
ncbi:MAG: phospho-N-acetylmuramoyl-pentapeptide-transferase [Chloroflexi bacterium]|nr:phospho-N-acetylmuramoyl-pentapeptide-transferase [Chloroflexota bacterium]MCL5110196.1 phospho-N-acetylmuramoyl-pentapeptide-transferase [Chloroflexota bacterium]